MTQVKPSSFDIGRKCFLLSQRISNLNMCHMQEVDATLVMGVGFENICTISGGWNVSKVVPRLYGWIYNVLWLFLLTAEDSVVAVTMGFQSGRPQFDSHRWPILDSCFIMFMFSSSGAMKFCDPSWGLWQCLLLQLKSCSTREASHNQAFMWATDQY